MVKRIRNSRLSRVLWSKAILWSFISLIILSLFSSSSNIWLSSLGTSLATGATDVIHYYLILLTVALFGSNVSEAISNYYLNQSKLNAIQNYTTEFANSHKNISTITFDSEIMGKKEPWLTGEHEKALDETLSAIHTTVGMTLNSVSNIATLAIVIDPKLAIGYSISLISMPLLLKYMKEPIKKVSLQSQVDRNSLRQILLSGWENISIGNSYNFKIWEKEFYERLSTLKKSSGKFTFLLHFSNFATMTTIMLPVFCNIYWLIKININNPKVLTAIAATLYKQIGTLFNMHTLFTSAMQWTSTYYPKLRALEKSLDRPSPRLGVTNNIKFKQIVFIVDKITCTIKSISEILEIMNIMKTGRVTIKGSNGSGKSTLLCILKEILEDEGFYLPANSKLIFQNSKKISLSSGQKMKIHLNELFEAIGNHIPKIILLDEWDANLDSTSIQSVSREIDNLSKRTLVFEVRHKAIEIEEQCVVTELSGSSLDDHNEHKQLTFLFGNKSSSFNRGLDVTVLRKQLNYSQKESLIGIEPEPMNEESTQLMDDKLAKKSSSRKFCRVV